MGQLAYFIEFLTLRGLWFRWEEGCPLCYTSPNASRKEDVLGRWLLSILSGHRRYSQVTTIRCDGVNPGLLWMNQVIREDALRWALSAIPEEEGVRWLDEHLYESSASLLDVAWILDVESGSRITLLRPRPLEQINKLKPKEEPPSLRDPKGCGNPVGRWIATSLRSSQ